MMPLEMNNKELCRVTDDAWKEENIPEVVVEIQTDYETVESFQGYRMIEHATARRIAAEWKRGE